MLGQSTSRLRRLALVTMAIAMVGCGLSVVGGEAGSSSSGGTPDGGRDAPPGDASNEPTDAGPDAPRCDGAPTCLPTDLLVLAPGQTVRAVALSGDKLYFINETAKTIVRAELDGSSPTDVFTTAEPARQLAVDGSLIWYTGPDLRRVATNGLGDIHIEQGVSGCIAVDPDKLTVYAADFDGSRIVSVGYASVVASDFLTADAGVAFPWGVAATTTDVYFTTSGARSGIIFQRSKTGTTNTVIKSDQANPKCLTFDESGSLYWVTNSDGAIHRSKVDGSDEVILVTGETNITQIAVDDKFVYWGSQNKLKRLTR